MNRLVKAEWYRVTKTYHLLLWSVILCAFLTFVGWLQISEESLSGIQSMGEFMEFAGMIMSYLAMFVGGMYVTSYENKMLNYEIMAGNKISHILLSKAVLIAPILTAIVTGFVGFIYIYFGEQNGYGDSEYVVAKFLLFAGAILRACLCSIFIMTTFKSVIGMFVVFLRFMVFEVIGTMIITLMVENSDNLSHLFCIMIQGQMTEFAMPTLTTGAIVVCIVSGIVETLFWYVLSYNSYKKRLFS